MSSTIQTSNKASYTDLRRVLTEMPPNNTISSRANKSNEQTTRNMQDDHQVNKKKEDDVTVASATIASCPLVDDRGPVPIHNEDMFVRVYSVLPEEKSEQNGADKKSATDVDDKDDRDDDDKDDNNPRRENSWMDDVIRAHEQGGCAVDVLKELVPIVVAERIDTSDAHNDAYDDVDAFLSQEVDGIEETMTKPSLGFMRHQHYMDTHSFAAKIRREVQASLARKS